MYLRNVQYMYKQKHVSQLQFYVDWLKSSYLSSLFYPAES